MVPARALGLIAFIAVLTAIGGCQSIDDLDREAYQRVR